MQKDWHQRLCSGVHADAILDQIIHKRVWVETGNYNMREHTALASTLTPGEESYWLRVKPPLALS